MKLFQFTKNFDRSLLSTMFVVIGILLAFLFFKKSKNERIGKIPKLIISLVLFVAPFLIYFAIHPIYEGDFSNNSYSVESNVDFPNKVGRSTVWDCIIQKNDVDPNLGGWVSSRLFRGIY